MRIKKEKQPKKKSKKQLFTEMVTAEGFLPYTIINGRVEWNQPYRFPDKEKSFRPRCINPGCINPVANFRGTVGELKGREIRTVCSQCHLSSYGKGPLPNGVTSFKKDYCENNNSSLGFKCTSTIHYPGNLELDHIDGNHYNNIPSNVMTLCKICHSYKSHLKGDHKKSPKVLREQGLSQLDIIEDVELNTSSPDQHSLF